MMRIGHGFDVHKFGEERPLILGGVVVPHDTGLVAHSDGDVVLHAVSDALLGAIAAGDIGQHFSDQDPNCQGADSRELMRACFDFVKKQGYKIGNLDCTIIAQAPKLAPHVVSMRENIALDLETMIENISVKATTTEKLGFTGRKEGIAVEAVVLLVKHV